MSCDPITVSPFTQAQFDAMVVKVNAAMREQGTTGVDASKDLTGVMSHGGVTLQWTYDPPKEILTIQCVKKPFFISCDFVAGKVKELLDEAAPPDEASVVI